MTQVKPTRLVSLDAFRGFTIAGMLLVNNPGDWANLYPQLAHAVWHGWTFTDWIFPFFLFICGVSMSFSLAVKTKGQILPTDQKTALVLSLCKRAGIIFLIGLCLNFIPTFDLTHLRVMGVLQRIALCIVLASPLVVFCNWRQQLLAILVLLVIYSICMLQIPMLDDKGVLVAGSLEPGRDFGSAIDRHFLSGHLWAKVKTWDPEGLFSTLPAVCSLLFGTLLGQWLLTKQSNATKTVWMMIAGLAALWLGAILDSVLMPINKSLWTPSYCLFMTGWALLVFAVFYWLIDGSDSVQLKTKSQQWVMPLTMYGMNALFIFAFSGLVAKMLGFIKVGGPGGVQVPLKSYLYQFLQALPLSPVNQSLLFAVLFNACFFVLAWYMWRRRWFIKV